MSGSNVKKYTPLSLELFRQVVDGKVGVEFFYEAPGLNKREILISVTQNGSIYAGTHEIPDAPLIFVNSAVDALHEFVDVHAEYTNCTIDRCQLDGSGDFDAVFIANIHILIHKFRSIDSKALDCRNNWWPRKIDPVIAGGTKVNREV